MAKDTNTQTKGKNIMPKFKPDYSAGSRRVYSNHVAVATTGLDFTISFMDVAPPTKEQVDTALKGEEVLVPLQCEVVVPNILISSLIKALQEQYKRSKNEKFSKNK